MTPGDWAIVATVLGTMAWNAWRTSQQEAEMRTTRGELADVTKTAAEAHRRCTDALKSKTEHEARIRELYERCNSLQAQLNVANRAAEHARGVR